MSVSNNRLQVKPQPQQQQPAYDVYRAGSNVIYLTRPSLKKRLLKAATILMFMGGLLGGIWYVVFGTAVDCDASAYNCLKH